MAVRTALTTLPIVAASLLISAHGAAFELSTTDEGTPLHWENPEVTWYIDAEMSGQLGNRKYKEAVQRSFAAWDEQSEITFVYGGKIEGTEVGWHRGEDNQNVVYWIADDQWDQNDEALAVTLTTFTRGTGALLDADIIINDNYTWTTDGGEGHDLANSVTHEVGHLLGLSHSPDKDATMYASTPRGETDKRTLSSDDIAGVAFLYGRTEGAVAPVDEPKEASADKPTAQTNPASDLDDDKTDLQVNHAELHLNCSTTGTTGRTSVPLSILAVFGLIGLAVARRRKSHVIALAAAAGLAVFCVVSTAGATTARHLDLGELVHESDAVVVGQVVAQASAFEGGVIWTTSTIQVDECWVGACESVETVEVRTLGGIVGDIEQRAAGVVSPTVGESAVFFARAARVSGALSPVGLAQGVLRVAALGDRQVAVRDLTGLTLVKGPRAIEGEDLSVFVPLAELRQLIQSL